MKPSKRKTKKGARPCGKDGGRVVVTDLMRVLDLALRLYLVCERAREYWTS